MMFSLFFQKIQKGLSVSAPQGPVVNDGKLEEATMVADDVKEGHFTVFAIKGDEKQRFIVELGYLADPAFLRLLDEAKEEYGFQQKGALAVPCRPEELQQILKDRRGLPVMLA